MEKKKVRRPVVQEEPELTTLYMIVQTQEEVDQHNSKHNKENISADDLKYEKESEEQQRVEIQNKENDKQKQQIKDEKSQSSTSEDDEDVEQAHSAKKRRHQRDNSDPNRKPQSVKDKKLEQFLQIPN